MADASLTKREFARVMKELMTRTSFAKISVGDICKASGISRKTFYYHFQDKFDLVNWTFYTEFVQVIQKSQPVDEWSFLRDLCAYLHGNRQYYLHAFDMEGPNAFKAYFASFFTPIVDDMMQSAFSNSTYQALYVTFFIDAFVMAIERWLRSGQMGTDDFIAFLKECIGYSRARALDADGKPDDT